MRLALAVVVLLLAVPLSGCLDLHAARVPDRLLEGRGGNGWAKNQSASQKEPTSAQMGLVKTQSFVYEDRTSDDAGRGFDGTLSVTTLRTVLRPSEEKLRDEVKGRVRAEAEAKGIRISGNPQEGTRTLANDAEAYWFSYRGTVSRAGFFSQSAEVRLFGEVSQCSEEETVVALVGLAQVSDVRSVGGVVLPSDPDDTTWREIVGDARGGVEGIRGSDGLAYNVEC